jgi:hypothetical protein
LAKPRINPVDYYQLVIDSLLQGPKKPAEIEKNLFDKVRHQYDNTRYILSEEEKKKRIKREIIKIRYIEYILRDLKDKGEVTQEKPFGRYFVTDRIFEKPKFAANLFGENAIPELDREINASWRNPFVNIDDDNFEEDYFNAKSLFEFANNLGAFMTYVMLDAVNPDDMKCLEKGSGKDELVKEKIINAIQIDRIFKEFCRLKIIKRGRAVYTPIPPDESDPPEIREEILKIQKKVRFMKPDDPKWSLYEMDKDNFQKALKAFALAYPNPYEILESVKEEMPQTIQRYKKSYIESVKRRRAAAAKKNETS